MPGKASELQDIINAIACRAIRHDVKTPLDHVITYCNFLRRALVVRPDVQIRLRRPAETLPLVTSIPQCVEEIDRVVTDLESTLKRRADYSGADARKVLKPLVVGACSRLESDANALKYGFDGIDQEMSEFATRIAKNAKVAKSRLSSLLAFFRDEYGQKSNAEFSLRLEAERAARDISPNSNVYGKVFRFSGDGNIWGNATLMQTLFQNIYENTIRYGGKTEELTSITTVSAGSFSSLSDWLGPIAERPPTDNMWVRVDFFNNGPPLPVSNPSAVFRLGKKFDVGGVSDDESQGIGMAICFAVATLHKGVIVADKRKNDVCFRLYVPVFARDGFSDYQLLSIARQMDIT